MTSRAAGASDLDALLGIFRALCIGVGSPRALKAALLVKYQEFDQLARMKIHPLEYCNADEFAGDYSIVSFLKKNEGLPKVCDTRQAAISSFAKTEVQCRETNDVFKAWTEGNLSLLSADVEVLHLAQRKISMLLPDVTSIEAETCSWGPGATFDLRRAIAYPDTKLTKLPLTVTGNAWKQAAELINSDLHWKEAILSANPGYTGPVFQVLPGGRYDTVPKTVLTDRSILVEATLNTVLQKRIGSVLRKRLRRVGVDLNDQSRNQSLASFARELGLATLDLEAASDSVATKLVQYLLPPDWFEALDQTRSRWYLGDDGWVRLEKFSSMGNGFTFELESLIFWALSTATVELGSGHLKSIGIYGDDIIVPKEDAPRLISVLRLCGFSLNKEKSFIDGEFFESCGKHYYGRQEVTPAYQKELPTDDAGRVRCANRLLRLAHRLSGSCILDKRVRPAWERACREYGFAQQQYGPYVGEGEGYVEAPASYYSNRSRLGNFGYISVRVRALCAVKRVIPAHDEAMLSLWLMSKPSVIADELGWFWGGKYMQRVPLPKPSVSVTGPGEASSDIEIGMIDTRLKPVYRIRHRRVEGTLISTALSW